MRHTKIQLRLPEDLKEAATRQAAISGISLNLFVALLSRLGRPETPRDDDRLDAAEESASGLAKPRSHR